MNRRTVFALVALLVIALAAVGVGYGLWFEDLKIHGDVTTGELDVDWSGPMYTDYFDVYRPDGSMYQALPGTIDKFEEVNCYAEVGNNLTDHPLGEAPYDEVGVDDPNTMLITVEGAYPSYHCLVLGNMVNVGTVPVHVRWYPQTFYPGVKFLLIPVEKTQVDEFEAGLAELAATDPAAAFEFAEGAAADVECTEGENAECWVPELQFHEGEGFIFLVDVHFDNLMSARFGIGEGETFSFGWVFRFYQWNEQPWMVIP